MFLEETEEVFSFCGIKHVQQSDIFSQWKGGKMKMFSVNIPEISVKIKQRTKY